MDRSGFLSSKGGVSAFFTCHFKFPMSFDVFVSVSNSSILFLVCFYHFKKKKKREKMSEATGPRWCIRPPLLAGVLLLFYWTLSVYFGLHRLGQMTPMGGQSKKEVTIHCAKKKKTSRLCKRKWSSDSRQADTQLHSLNEMYNSLRVGSLF